MTETRISSILAADFGNLNTRVLLFDVVEGEYRLVAQGLGPTTIGSPTDDVHIGLSRILREIGAATHRRFLDEQGRLIRPEQDDHVGVDYFLTTTSAGNPVRVVIVGLYPKLSIAAVKRAVAPFYIDVVSEVHLEDGLGARGRLNRIVHSRPQLIIVTGGTDGGARTVLLEMLALVRKAVSLLPHGEKPTLLFSGNSSLSMSVREMLSQQVEVLIAPNIRQGSAEVLEPVQAALGQYYDEHKRHSVSFKRSASMSDLGIRSTARGVETMTAFFARTSRRDVLSIDFGSARSMLSLASEGVVQTVIRNDIGLGHSAATALDVIGEEAIAEWLPFHPRKGELAQYTLNKGLRLSSVPEDMRERTIEYALLRAGIRKMLADLTGGSEGDASALTAQVGLVLIGGATFAGSGQGALDMLLLADALASDGVLQVKADPYGGLAALGTLAAVEPLAVVQLAGSNVLQNVGSLIRVSGRAAAGAKALTVKVKRGQGETMTREVNAGDVWHLPVAAGETVELRIEARRGLAIGGKRRLRLKVQGGRGGVLFDARLGALAAAATMTERAVNMLRWYAAVTGQEQPVAIPESWLAAPDA